MHFGFTLNSSDIDLWNIDLLDEHLDLVDTDNSSKHFVCLQDVLQTSPRHVLKTSSRHALKMPSRRLQDVFKTSSAQQFFVFQDVLQDLKLLRSKRVEDVFKTCLEDVFKTSSRPTNICWAFTRLKKKEKKSKHSYSNKIQTFQQECLGKIKSLVVFDRLYVLAENLLQNSFKECSS